MNHSPLFFRAAASICILGMALGGGLRVAAQVTLELETTTFVPAVTVLTSDVYGPSSAAGTASVATAYGSATATATFGSMHLHAFSSADPQAGSGDTVTTSSFARAVWSDSILVTATGLAGTPGRLHAQFLASGSLSLPASVNSTFTGAQPVVVSWSLGANPNSGFGGEGQVDGSRQLYIDLIGGNPESVLSGSANFQVYDLYIPFTFGDAFELTITGRAASFVQPRGMNDPLTASSTFNLNWLGVTEVLDESDNPLSGISIQSTGDWITASTIPEPSTYAAVAGLAALGLAVWRRRGRLIQKTNLSTKLTRAKDET